jgi:16S rRNA (cytosine967-C5)-methyltransferase
LNSVFDRALLDAPCSGLGVLRRNPDAKWRKKASDLTRLSNDQKRLLGRVASMVKKGGCLVYCVCSLEPEEGEQVTKAFLKSHPQFEKDLKFPAVFNGEHSLMDSQGFFRSFPHRHDMDGFFAVRLRRSAS